MGFRMGQPRLLAGAVGLLRSQIPMVGYTCFQPVATLSVDPQQMVGTFVVQ